MLREKENFAGLFRRDHLLPEVIILKYFFEHGGIFLGWRKFIGVRGQAHAENGAVRLGAARFDAAAVMMHDEITRD